MKIGVIVAMQKEYDALLGSSLFKKEAECHLHISPCGIGKVNAALGALDIIERFKPDCIVSTGCAGGALPSMCVGDTVVSTAVQYHDVYCGEALTYGQVQGMPAEYDADAQLVAIAKKIASDRFSFGLIASGDWFVNTKEKMGYILDHVPRAIAVDMESAAIAQTCYLHNVPFISFRTVSDVPLCDTRGSQYFDFWDRLAATSFSVTRNYLDLLIKTKQE